MHDQQGRCFGCGRRAKGAQVQHLSGLEGLQGRCQSDKASQMMDATDMAVKSEALRAQLREKLGVRSRDLAQGFKRAGREIPRHLRADGKLLAQAETYVAHPKLAKRVDAAAVGRAFANIGAHLKTVDAADRRKGFWLGLAGSIVFNLLVIGGMFVLFMWWRGHI